MPCYDPRDRELREENKKIHQEHPKLIAMLCALSDTLQWVDPDLIKSAWNEKKAGVSYKEYQKWLAEHRKEDASREKRRTTLKGYLK